MKNKLSIRTYSLSVLVVLMIWTYNINTQAQIIYTDIEPDFTSPTSGDFYNLDLNNDDIVDYTLSLWSDSLSDYLLISSPNGINASITVTPWYANTVPLENGMEIFNLVGAINGETYLYWGVFTIGNCFGGDATCSYDWKNKIDKFLGLRFLIDGQTHYGWARLDVTSHTQWVIKDYAYNATPNQHIFAGQSTLGLEESNHKDVKIIVAHRQISIINLPNHTEYTIYTINGQRILQGNLDKINNTINVQYLTSGLYIIEMIATNSASTIRRKIIIA